MAVVFEDNSIQCINAIEEKILQFLEEAGGEVEAAAVRNSRSSTGDTAGKWDHIVDESAHTVTIGNPMENAIWEEFGTGEWAQNGDGRKDAWYIPVDTYTGRKAPTFNGQVVVVQSKSGMAFYKTNGKKPNRTLQRSWEEKKGQIKGYAESALGELG